MAAVSSAAKSVPQKDTRSGPEVLGETVVPNEWAQVFQTELGWTLIRHSKHRLLRLSIGHPTAIAACTQLSEQQLSEPHFSQRRLEPRGPAGNLPEQPVPGQPGGNRPAPAWVDQLVDRVQRYAQGRRVQFNSVPLDQSRLTDFQRRVVDACRTIPRGQTRSYGVLAAAAGSPRAARAVGTVMANNRFPLIVPCHRVVGCAGLGGFSAPSGLDLKRRLLALEGYRD